MKAISAVIATIMLLMITVSLVGVFYVFSSTLASQSTSSGSAQASQLTAQLSMCMQIDNIVGNQITLRNCGKGVIENKSLVVMMDDIVLGASTNTIQEGNSGVVNVSGLWQMPFGKRNLKISNGAAVALALVDVQPNRDGLAESWNFDEGSGTTANDGSGNGNIGTLLPSGSEPTWVNGKFGKELQFDGTNDYVDAGNATNFSTFTEMTIGFWINESAVKVDALVIGKTNSFLFVNNNGQFQPAVHNGTQWRGTSYFSVSVSQLHYVVITVKNGNKIQPYVDGVAQSSQSFLGKIQQGSGTLQIGSNIGGNAFWNGIIDEVRIWSRSLAPDETVAMKRII